MVPLAAVKIYRPSKDELFDNQGLPFFEVEKCFAKGIQKRRFSNILYHIDFTIGSNGT